MLSSFGMAWATSLGSPWSRSRRVRDPPGFRHDDPCPDRADAARARGARDVPQTAGRGPQVDPSRRDARGGVRAWTYAVLSPPHGAPRPARRAYGRGAGAVLRDGTCRAVQTGMRL